MPSCLLMRIMVRMRVSVVCMRIIAPRTRMRTLGSAFTVTVSLRIKYKITDLDLHNLASQGLLVLLVAGKKI